MLGWRRRRIRLNSCASCFNLGASNSPVGILTATGAPQVKALTTIPKLPHPKASGISLISSGSTSHPCSLPRWATACSFSLKVPASKSFSCEKSKISVVPAPFETALVDFEVMDVVCSMEDVFRTCSSSNSLPTRATRSLMRARKDERSKASSVRLDMNAMQMRLDMTITMIGEEGISSSGPKVTAMTAATIATTSMGRKNMFRSGKDMCPTVTITSTNRQTVAISPFSMSDSEPVLERLSGSCPRNFAL
mmetsp:Transcript_12684/g.22431  ORF Transcript_12684/g.22431 Transcript_12684/m.22431 type:complete len:250 (-) Transcript_12684:290-1039(-)